MRAVPPLRERPAWAALERHHATIADTTLRDLFADDPARGERMTVEDAGLFLDYSKNRVTDETISLLLRLAEESGLAQRREAMFSGARINTTEDRAVLHTALRAPRTARVMADGVDVVPGVHEVLERMAVFADGVRSGSWVGHTGRPIKAVVNIGIGGSDLGPVMAYEALRAYSQRDITFRFVSMLRWIVRSQSSGLRHSGQHHAVTFRYACDRKLRDARVGDCFEMTFGPA